MTVAAPFDTGIVTISLDTELGWGNVHSGDYSHVKRRMDSGKEAIRRLLDCFERYDVPATWAIVGQLCRDWTGTSPPLGSEPTVKGKEMSWSRDWWHAPDLVDAIDASPVDHEIGSHSANHLVYGDATAEEVRADIDLFESLTEDYAPVTSMVFPRNNVGHRPVLAERGFDCYRGRPPTLGSDPLPTVFRPRRHAGLVNVPASTALRHYNGRAAPLKYFPTSLKRRLLKLGVTRARRRGGVFHVVLHPNDFTLADGDRLLSAFDAFISRVDEQRAAGNVRVCTMRDVASLAQF